MTRRPYDPRSDAELFDTLDGDPELLRTAQIFAAHGRAATAARRRARHRMLAAATLALAAIGAVLVASPWRGGSSPFVDRAYAAVGGGAVLHAVVRARDPLDGVVDLRTRRFAPRVIERDIWYHADDHRLHVLTRRGGRLVSNTEPASTGTPIAAHSTPAAVAAFVAGYRGALRAGSVRPKGMSKVDGAAVRMFEFGHSGETREQVAIDVATARAVAFWAVGPSGRRVAPAWRIALLRATDGSAEPHRAAAGRVAPVVGAAASKVLGSESAPSVRGVRLGGDVPLWPGDAIGSLSLRDVQQQRLGSSSGRAVGAGLALLYGTVSRGTLVRSAPYVEVLEARLAASAYFFQAQAVTFNGYPLPGANAFELAHLPQANGRDTWIAQLRHGPFYVTVEASSRSLAEAAVFHLVPA